MAAVIEAELLAKLEEQRVAKEKRLRLRSRLSSVFALTATSGSNMR